LDPDKAQQNEEPHLKKDIVYIRSSNILDGHNVVVFCHKKGRIGHFKLLIVLDQN